MKLSLLILGAPYSTQANYTALRFTLAALNSGHEIFRVFFYHDAVGSGNSLITPSQDESSIPIQWQKLAKDHKIDLVICISSALNRGILDKTEAERYDKPAHNLAADFNLSGLGQLVDASIHSDRLVTFGA